MRFSLLDLLRLILQLLDAAITGVFRLVDGAIADIYSRLGPIARVDDCEVLRLGGDGGGILDGRLLIPVA